MEEKIIVGEQDIKVGLIDSFPIIVHVAIYGNA